MEQLRWLPDDLGQRYVFINQPAFTVYYVTEGREQLAMRLISGESFVDNKKLVTGRLGEEDWSRIAAASASLSNQRQMVFFACAMFITRAEGAALSAA